MPERNWLSANRSLAIVVSILVVSAGGLGAWLYLAEHGSSGAVTVSKADGPTFYQALSALNGSVASQSGEPWTLYAVWGIASPLAFSPNAFGWSSYNLTVNSCQAQFNGLTLWNGTIPLFNGSFNSGTAPFWQFAFFSNASQSILIATDVLGIAHVYPPMSMSSTCAEATSLSGEPWEWAGSFSPFPANSPVMAQSAWNARGDLWMTMNEPAYEVFVMGFSYWGSANPEGLIVKFARCGEVGATSVQPVLDVILNSDGSWSNYLDGLQGCGDVITLNPLVYGSYYLDFATTNVSSESGTLRINQSMQVTYGKGVGNSDASGLVSWMTTLNLSDSAGQLLESGTPGCATWVSSVANCSADSSGWYAVLTSPTGAWLDSYPSSDGASTWEIPNVSFASNQCLDVVVPSAWNVTGDTLSFNGTAPHAAVNGAAVI